MTLSRDILLIEDDPEHARAIEEFLVANNFRVTLLPSSSDLEITNYKARANYFLIIVDEVLDFHKEGGFRLILENLVKLDRTTPYILFSEKPQDHRASKAHATPALKFIEKQCIDHAIGPKGFEDLLGAVNGYMEFQIPTFRAPDYLAVRQNMETEIDQYTWSGRTAPDALIAAIDLSGNLVNKIATFASSLNRIGANSENITVGVFGSYGRFEARKSSDMEFSVLYDGDNETIAQATWNRIYRYCREVLNIEVEGQKDIGDLLTSKYVESTRVAVKDIAQIPLNSYSPVYSPSEISDPKWQSMYPHVLFRAYQLLAEMSPVFNQGKMDSIKGAILGIPVDTNGNAFEVLLSEKMKTICEEFVRFVRPNNSKELKDVVKTALFRTLGALAFRVSIIRIVKFERTILATEGGKSRLFQELCAPPFIKLLRMNRSLLTIKTKVKAIPVILSRYALVYEKMSGGITDDGDLDSLEEALNQFEYLFHELRKICDDFGERGKWVFNTDEIASLQRSIIGAVRTRA